VRRELGGSFKQPESLLKSEAPRNQRGAKVGQRFDVVGVDVQGSLRLSDCVFNPAFGMQGMRLTKMLGGLWRWRFHAIVYRRAPGPLASAARFFVEGGRSSYGSGMATSTRHKNERLKRTAANTPRRRYFRAVHTTASRASHVSDKLGSYARRGFATA